MNKKVLLCDMDGVICDLLPAWLQRYATLTGEYIHPDKVYAYHHEQFVGNQEAWWEALEYSLFHTLPMSGSSALEHLSPYYDVHVVTYCHPAAPDAYRLKREWMAKWFPWFPQDRIIAVRQKAMVRGDYLIEDNAVNIHEWERANIGGEGLLVKQPYNPHGLTWSEIATFLTHRL